MKKIGILTILAVVLVSMVLVFTGCGEEGAKGGNGIVGSWTYPNTTYTYIFNADGTGSYAGKDFTYELDGDKISILYDGNTDPFVSTYSIYGNKRNILDSLGNETIYEKR